jgi:hypothetical protein
MLINCSLSGNSARDISQGFGGGATYCTLSNCTLIGNTSSVNGGGAYQSTLSNCILTGNTANGGGGTHDSTLHNCTVIGNTAQTSGGGVLWGTCQNCIVYYNRAPIFTNYGSKATFGHSCTVPLPPSGVGNITSEPALVDQTSGNLRLQSNSPCINAGNNSYVTDPTDLDGKPRIAGGAVDIGAYEFQSPASMISYAWLQQYGLPINAATDTADPDGDGVNNYHEWLAGSDPTDPFSFPPLLTLIPYGANVILTWTTNAFGFTLQSTTNLGSPSFWSTSSPAPVVIGGQNVIINPLSGPQQFYRLSQ